MIAGHLQSSTQRFNSKSTGDGSRSGNRELDCEYTSLLLFALYAQTCVVSPVNPFRDRQPQARAVHLTTRWIGAHKPIEDPWQQDLWNSDSGVADRENRSRGGCL